MPYQTFDLKPVDRITADAIGEPGERVFYLQARQGNQLVTVICEKEHVAALALAVDHVCCRWPTTMLTPLSNRIRSSIEEWTWNTRWSPRSARNG